MARSLADRTFQLRPTPVPTTPAPTRIGHDLVLRVQNLTGWFYDYHPQDYATSGAQYALGALLTSHQNTTTNMTAVVNPTATAASGENTTATATLTTANLKATETAASLIAKLAPPPGVVLM